MRQRAITHSPDASADDLAALKCELAGDVLRSFGELRFTATGWSMLPAIFPGDTLVVERVHPNNVVVGDVVLVGRGGRLCAHRLVSTVVDAECPKWITRGDGMPGPDRPVVANELLGRVAYLIRAGKLITVPTKLGVVEKLVAKVVQRSEPAARALVYLQQKVHTPETVPPRRDQPCQD
ncbi:MAG: hypothetical protein WAN65_30420 [Candidatus Sulfotelmatobacter sp.]